MDLRCPDVQIPEIEMLDILKSSILSYFELFDHFRGGWSRAAQELLSPEMAYLHPSS